VNIVFVEGYRGDVAPIKIVDSKETGSNDTGTSNTYREDLETKTLLTRRHK
jgi:hypothetical protein